MQSSDHGSPSSSLPASIPNDIVLRPNATSDEKLQLLALLVPKAENARNRVADLHAKTSANLDKCLKFAAQIKEVHVYAQLFFTQMNPQLVTVHRLVTSLSAHRPQIGQLEQQLSVEKQKLEEFTSTLAKLRTIRVHAALRDYLLPELPPSECTGTLADWANASELLTAHKILSDDLDQMQALADWGTRQIGMITDKQKIVSEEAQASTALFSQLQLVEVDTITSELLQTQKTADGVLAECTSHFTRVSDALKSRDVLALPTFMANDLNLATQLLAINKCRSRVNTLLGELQEAVTRSDELVSKLQALGSETIKFTNECSALVTEFEHMEADINSYTVPTAEENGYADLKRSVDAWGEFMKTYDAMVVEIERRRQALLQQRMIAMRYQRELQALYERETAARHTFDSWMAGANIPPSWTSLEFLAEPPVAFNIIPNMAESILPDLSDPGDTNDAIAAAAAAPSSSSSSNQQVAQVSRDLSQSIIPPPSPIRITPPPRIQLIPSANSYLMIPEAAELYDESPRSASLPANPSLRLSPSNSLLGSAFSLSESMLDDNDLYLSATDQAAASSVAHSAALPPHMTQQSPHHRVGSSPALFPKK